METDLSKISCYFTEYLTGAGVHAVDAWEGKAHCDHAVVVVSLGECQVDASGMGDYLGEMEREEGLTEIYGKRCAATLGLTFYAPVKGGEKGIQAMVSKVLSLMSEPEMPFRMGSFSAGVSSVDGETGLLKREVSVRTQVYLYYLEGCTEWFMDIDIKGELKDAN